MPKTRFPHLFYLIYFYIYVVLFTSVLFVVLKDETTLKINLLFGLIGHFGLLKDVNISFFLSVFLSRDNHILSQSARAKIFIMLLRFNFMIAKLPGAVL